MTPGERRAATEVLFTYYWRPVLSMVSRIVKHSQDAEDVAQQVWIIVYRHAHELGGPSKSVTAWMTQVCHNAAIDCVRRRRRQLAHTAPVRLQAWTDEAGEAPLPDALIDRRTPERLVTDRDEANRVLAALPPETARVFRYLATSDATYSEAARHFALPWGTFKSRIRRRQQLHATQTREECAA